MIFAFIFLTIGILLCLASVSESPKEKKDRIDKNISDRRKSTWGGID